MLDLTAYYGKHDLAKYTYFYFLPSLSRDIKLKLGEKISSYYGVPLPHITHYSIYRLYLFPLKKAALSYTTRSSI